MIQYVNIGSQPNDGSGDPLRDAFHKINQSILHLVLDSEEDLQEVSDMLESANGLTELFIGEESVFDLFSAVDHHHDGRYSLIGHTHSSLYSPLGHLHTGVYATPDHLHTGVYSPVTHLHDTRYALISHEHPEIIELIVTGGGGTGTGDVLISGTPELNQIAIWSTPLSIKGLPGMTYDGTTLTISGNIIASGEISAFQGSAPGSWWDSMPLASDTSVGGIKYSPDFFQINVSGQLEILSGVLIPDDHEHSWSDITSGKPTTLAGYGITDAFNGVYSSLTGIPTTFTPSAHNQAWSTITGTPTTKAGYGISNVPDISGTPLVNQIAIWTDFDTQKGDPNLKWDGTNLFVVGNIVATGEVSAFQGSAPTSWWDSMPLATADAIGGIRYNGTQFETIGGIFQIKAGVLIPASHAHSWADITSGKPTTLAGYGITDSFNGVYSSLTGIPSTFTPAAHTQAWSTITGTPSTYSPSAHNQAWSTITSTPTTKAGYGITNVPDISGIPEVNQLAIWTDADTQKGDSKLVWDGTTLTVTGNIVANGEISAFQGTAPTSWWDSMPVATATSIGGVMYDPDFFFVNTGGQLEILPNVISAAEHNHDERYYTEAETTSAINVAIASLVDSSPTTLNTLNELAAALGDDPNFATTVSTNIGLKANINSPTFTGTVSGITKSMVGLANVDNTTDLLKPISTVTQTALNLKANLASPTFTGTVSGITASMVGLGNVTNESKATMFTNPIFTGNLNVIGRIKASYADLGIETYIDTISGNAYIDSLKDDAGYNMNIRMRSSGTPVTNATFFGNGDTTLYGNVSIGSNPNEREFALTKDEAGDVVMQIQNTNVAGTTSRSVLLTGMENDGASIGFYAHGTNHSGTAYGETLAKAAVLSFGANTDKAIIAVGKATVPLMFATNGDVRMTLGTSGNLTVQGDVIAYG